jgi:hypothetical protein
MEFNLSNVSTKNGSNKTAKKKRISSSGSRVVDDGRE